ncbi:MAG TPA: hypothetical protein VLA77_01390 [Candidatus Saccharimonadales bacterium]|nr:hypothetical protein [Candidatus Saccharimonadales bacterium]
MVIFKRYVLPLLGVALIALSLFSNLLHAQSNTAIARGFQTSDTNLAPGALMSLTNTADTVTLADPTNTQKLVGVLDDRPLLELDSDNKQVQVQVVTSGVTYALVSDMSGTIQTGDKITTSPIRGVGMKTLESNIILGTAQSNFSTDGAVEQTITQKDGSRKKVMINKIPVQVSVNFYQTPTEQTNLPPILNDLASTVAGRQVSPVRIIVALLILLVALITMAILLYSSVKSSVISIGRNPLSEHAVYKSLWQIGLIVLGILLLTVIAIYFILTT